MEFQETVRRRRMVRSYTDEAVDRDVIARIVRTARRAPSAGFSQGQRFVVVTDADTRRAIAELANEEAYVAQGFGPWISVAPVHIVVCTEEDAYHRRYREPDKLTEDGDEIAWPIPYWHTDAGASMMLLLLGAVDEGLGAGFFGVHRLAGLRDLLGIPEAVTPIGIVTVGHPQDDQPTGSATRGWQDEADIVRWHHW